MDSSFFLNTLTPKFYVALTGTSSLISGLILIFEWWYFRKYGTSFIGTYYRSPLCISAPLVSNSLASCLLTEQVSLNHISPWIGGGGGSGGNTNTNNNNPNSDPTDNNNPSSSSSTSSSSSSSVSSTNGGTLGAPNSSIPECKVWRNSFNLFRSAEYQRFFWATNKEPLTYYDMNLSAQDHQTFFTCEGDAGKPEYEMMQTAWRERNPVVRIQTAHNALKINPECATAYILLAEEEATTIESADRILKTALKIAEANFKRSQYTQHQGHIHEALHRRDTNVQIYIKRRLAMCARKLGKLKEAAKLFRDLTKENSVAIMSVLNIHENLIETLLEMQSYSDCQAVLAKYDDISLPKSATICYTAALLKARVVADKFSPDTASKRGLSAAEMSAVEAIHRAVEFNPHVPKYLLEMKPLILPPEHILKRGDSEALAYSFFHLRHWKNVEGALNLLHCTWEGTFRMLPSPLERGHLFFPYPTCTECADRELLPNFHKVSVYPKKELPFFILFTAGLCSFTALLALLTHQYPAGMAQVAQAILQWVSMPFYFLRDRIEWAWPGNFLQQLTRI